jgi:hypothetical protein
MFDKMKNITYIGTLKLKMEKNPHSHSRSKLFLMYNFMGFALGYQASSEEMPFKSY